MKLKHNMVRSVAAFASIVLLAAGCGGKAKKPDVELTIWKPFVDSETFRPLIDAYQKGHSNVRITYVEKDSVSYEQDLIDALAAGQGPDIFSINNAQLPEYINKITPAQESFWHFVDYRSAFLDTVVSDFTKDNRVYGTATSVDSLALYYNKSFLASAGVYTPPKTWAQLATAVQKLTRQNGVGYFSTSGVALGLSSQAPSGKINRGEDILYLFMLQKGAVPWRSDGSQPTFGESVQKNGELVNPAVDALTFYTSFANPESQNYTWNSRSDYSIDSFVNGRAAMMINYSYARDTIRQKNATLDFGIAPVPQPNLTDPEVNFSNYYGEVVSKQSKNADAAWDFLKFITSSDSLNAYYATAKVPTSRKDLVSVQVADPEIGVFAHAGASARPFYRPQAAKVDGLMAKMIDRVTLRGTAPDTAVQEAVSQAATLTIPNQ